MSFEVLSWFLVGLSLAGNIFVVQKNVLGQWLWALSNIGWITYDLYIGATAQAFLFMIYFGMCVWGIIVWSRKETPALG